MFDKYCSMGYRNDIQGVRALGAILIMIFHIWVNKVSGGVDVFFVISGFLMSFILLRGYFKDNIINPFLFWGSIVKRIAPSAYVVLGVTLFVSYLISVPNSLYGSINEIVYSSLHLENLQLIRKSIDYLASDSTPSPVQQFWALSLQMQFYFLLPLTILPLAYVSKRVNSSMPLIYGVIIVVILSFIYSIIETNTNPTRSYFNPIARAWEFFLGTLTFILTSNIKKIKGKNLLGSLGIMLILGGSILIPSEAAFPGFIALIPVTGAILILLSGKNELGFINKILSSRPLTFLGGISFAIYLWHWPILIFYKEYYGYDQVGIPQGTIIIITAILLACITNRGLEDHFNKIPSSKVITNFTIAILFLIPVLSSSFILTKQINTIITNTNNEVRNQIIPSAPISKKIYIESNIILPDRNAFLSAGWLGSYPPNSDCSQEEHGSNVKFCRLGKLNSKNKIILVGSSHAGQWLPALDLIGQKNNFEIINMTKDFCPLGPLVDSNPSCHEWNDNVIKEIKKINPYAVITNSTKTEYGRMEHIPKSFVETWRTLQHNGINIIGIRDNPRFEFNTLDCIYRNKHKPELCSLNRSEIFQEVNPAIHYKDLIDSIDMTDMLCTAEKCLTTFSGHFIYRDTNHLHLPYIKYLKNQLEYKLNTIMDKWSTH